MRRVAFYLILTADGMYADAEGGLDHYDPADDEHRYANGLIDVAGDIVMGRGMYDVMTYWDELDLEDPFVPEVAHEFARFWRATPKHVASRGRPSVGPNADVIDGDVVEAVRRMRDGDGPDIGLGCGADIFADLSRAGLIDDYRFLVIPVALGSGKSLFGSLDSPLRLRLSGTRTF
jgi:dihydrofolate reductase